MPDPIALSTAELEQVQTLMTVRQIRSVDWDVLGAALVVQACVGQEGRLLDVPVSLTPAAAVELWTLLGRALQETGGAAGTPQ